SRTVRSFLPSIAFLATSCFASCCPPHHRALRSFPTRRSSDLRGPLRPVGQPRPRGDADLAAAGAVTALRRGPVLTPRASAAQPRSEEHTSELQSRFDLVCRLLLEKKKYNTVYIGED